MAKAIDEKIPDIGTSWEGYAGSRVEEFIKGQFGSVDGKFGGKYGYFNLRFNDEQKMYYIECFATEEDYKLFESDMEAHEALRLQNVQIPISTVKGDSYAALLSTSIPNTAALIVTGDEYKVPMNFRGVQITQLGNVNAGAPATVVIERSTDGGSSYSEVERIEGALPSESYEDDDIYTDVDIAPYLTNGTQSIRLRAFYTYEDTEGKTQTATSANVYIGSTVTMTQLKLELRYDYEYPIDAYSSTGTANKFPLSNFYYVQGAVQKTLHVELEGSLATLTIEQSLDASYDSTMANLADLAEDNAYGYLTHGVHKVKAWMTADDGLGNEITSNVLVNRVMVVNANTAGANLLKPYLLLQNVESEVVNFVQTELCQYAVYIPKKNDDGTITNDGDPLNIAFLLTEYTEDYEVTVPNEYFRVETEVSSKTAASLLTTVEIEGEDNENTPSYDAYFRVRLLEGDTSSDFMYSSTGETNYAIEVDNSQNFSPIAGASFLINPKVRNNTESDPARILNARANNAEVESEWNGFGFVNDGWVTADDGQKVLRIPAGASLTIKKSLFAQMKQNPNSSLTMDIDFAVHNVTNESDPILDITETTASGGFKGLRMCALDGWLMTASYTSKNDCLFSWLEDKRTFISVNLNHQVSPNKGDVVFTNDLASVASGTLPLARVLVNGDPYREIPYDVSSTEEWATDSDIVIGNAGVDIDIYSIRIYENKAIDMVDLLNRNYVASRPTAVEKVETRRRNNILTSGRIDLEKAKQLGINCMVWHGELPYHASQGEQKGYYEYFRYNENGNYLPEYSGTNCKASKALKNKGQGSTAKTYYDWNQQDDNSKIKYNFADGSNVILVPLEDFHSSIVVSVPYEGTIEEDEEEGGAYTGTIVDIYGGNLGKNFPLENETRQYPYINGSVMVPDGWIDGNGKYRGMGYMVAPNTALAQKKVLKINYASSMQSHLLGACKTYDLLHRAVVGATPLQKVVPTAVTAKHTEAFMLFQQSEGSSNVYYKGLGNYGAGKMDKVAWGYVKKKHPMFALIEGSDNNLPMTGFRVPFDKKTAVYSPSGEGWLYNGIQNFDFDGGATIDGYTDGWATDGTTNDDGEVEVPSVAVRGRWAAIHNFIYLHAPSIKYFVGSFAQFKASTSAEDTNYKYWCTGDFNLYRYDHLTSSWINAGLLDETTDAYRAINLKTDSVTKSVYEAAVAAGTATQYAQLNQAFIAAIVANGKKYLKYFINPKSLQFNYAYVLSFLAGTDNSDKNTYYEIMPYEDTTLAASGATDEGITFSAWYATVTGSAFDFSTVYQVYLNGDDMDSVLKTDNNSHQTKPYYIDRQHPSSDDNPEKSLYEGTMNALFNFCEQAYESTGELSGMLNSILTAACSLVSATDKVYEDISVKVSVWGFLHKYFFNTQHYFPQIAYMEQARIRYEFPQLIGFTSSGSGARAIKPITQSLGSQLESELQYMTKRLVYMASYAGFGAFGGNTTSAIGLDGSGDSLSWMPSVTPDGKKADYTVNVRPHQYIYPTGAIGQTSIQSHERVSPRDTYAFTIAKEQETSDTGISLFGINYYSSVGNFGDISVQPERAFDVLGKRLVEFVANPATLYDGKSAFRPSQINVLAPQLRVFSVAGCSEIGQRCDLSLITRCEEIDLTSTQIYGVTLPHSTLLTTVRLGANIQKFSVDDAPNLSTLTFEGYDKMTEFVVGDNVGTLDSMTYATQLYAAKVTNATESTAAMQTISLKKVNWTDLPIAVMMWMTDSAKNLTLTGSVGIYEPLEYQPSVSFARKNAINNKFGNVDDATSPDYRGLLLTYKQRELQSITVKGNYVYSDQPTGDYPFSVEPNDIYCNTFTKLRWSTDPSQGSNSTFAIDEITGVLTVTSVTDIKDDVSVIATADTYYEGSVGQVIGTKSISIYRREAQLGDVVYADGSYGDPNDDDGTKTVVGVCFYVAPRDDNGDIMEDYFNPSDKMTRLMVAVEDVTCMSSGGTNNSSFPWGAYSGTDAANSLYGPSGQLAVTGLTSVYDIPTITNITSNGMASGSYVTTEQFRDSTSPDYGFKAIAADKSLGDGFAYGETAALVSQRTFKDVAGGNLSQKSLLDLVGKDANGNPLYEEGDVVNSGYIKTLKIIQHRNHVLATGIPDINLDAQAFPAPAAGAGTTELDSLANLMDSIASWSVTTNSESMPNKWKQLYCPAASAAYAYQPKNLKADEVLADKFKSHNWFLATNGMLARLYWYIKVASTAEAGNVLAPAIGKGLISFSTSSYHWSCTETNSLVAWGAHFGNGYTAYNSKYYDFVVRAVAAF